MARFLTEAPIRLDAMIETVRSDVHGAVVTFLGTVRNHHAGRVVTGLSYSAYLPMAEAVCAQVVDEAEGTWACRVALAHRLGQLAVGDSAVAVAVASAHRDDGFAACRFVIEAVKRRVPIWKYERYADGGSAWVDPTAVDGIRDGEASRL